MPSYLIRRLAWGLLVLFGVTILVFLIMQLVPSDPARAALGPSATSADIAALRHEMGLDRSLISQYSSYLSGLFHGDLGQSLSLSVPVSDVMLPKLMNTIVLAAGTLVLCVTTGVLIGITAGRREGSLVDRVVMFVSIAGASVPVYWAALVVIAVFALSLGWFPTSGMHDMRSPGGLGDLLTHLFLPAAVTAVVPTAIIARLTRATLIEALQQDSVRLLRASGVPERLVVWRHAVRNIVPAVVTIVGLQVGYLLGGVIFTEVVFNWPGLGSQLYTAITANDMPVIQAGVLFIAIVFVVVNLLADTAATMSNPRTRMAAR
jgi:peptide/nickel transport system permease protein